MTTDRPLCLSSVRLFVAAVDKSERLRAGFDWVTSHSVLFVCAF